MRILACLVILLFSSAAHAAEGKPAPQREWVRIWPVATNGPATVRNRPSIGPGAVDWFQFGAGTTKTFEFIPGQTVLIRASGDSCGGCMLGNVAFKLVEVSEKQNPQRIEFKGPTWRGTAPAGEPTYRYLAFTPKGKRYTVSCISRGFYIQIYQGRARSRLAS